MLKGIYCLCLIAFFICKTSTVQGCNVYRTSADDDYTEEQLEEAQMRQEQQQQEQQQQSNRRKRQIRQTSLVDNIINTRELRRYFTACLTSLAPSFSDNWRTNVDYSVLDTAWFEDNAVLNCGFGYNRTECWKLNLRTYINRNSPLIARIDRCIDFYAEDFLPNPNRPNLSRFPTLTQSRTKRQSINYRDSRMIQYSNCLADRIVVSNLRQSIDWEDLTEFIEDYTIRITCYNDQGTLVDPWPSRLVAFTRLDSPLRYPLLTCGEDTYPTAFPMVFDPVQENVWGEWSQWSDCSRINRAQCRRTRQRICLTNGEVSNLNLCECNNNSGCGVQSETCNPGNCGRPSLSNWITVRTCPTFPCGPGYRVQIKECIVAPNRLVEIYRCQGVNARSRLCSYPPRCKPPPISTEYTEWTNWSSCSVSCTTIDHPGTRVRERCLEGTSTCTIQRTNCLPRPC